MGLSDNFENRIQALPWVKAVSTSTGEVVLAVDNQLLVDAEYDAPVMGIVHGLGVSSRLLTTLFDGLPPNPGQGDVNIYELTPTLRHSALLSRNGIFGLVDNVRHEAGKDQIPAAAISPNHLLIPAVLGSSCPSGPPFPYVGEIGQLEIDAPLEGGNRVFVTVIDAGWQWDNGWGPNRVAGHVNNPVVHAERLPMVAELGPAPASGHWMAGVSEPPGEQLQDGHLPALAGHANFIAGVIARH
jgi:hypothetical protein